MQQDQDFSRLDVETHNFINYTEYTGYYDDKAMLVSSLGSISIYGCYHNQMYLLFNNGGHQK